MALNLASWSPLSMSKVKHTQPPHTTPCAKKMHPQQQQQQQQQQSPAASSLPSAMSHAHDPLYTSRSSSLVGRKRPRESDGETSKLRLARRTKSAGDVSQGRRVRDKDKEAFQRSLIAVFVPNALNDASVGKMEHFNDLLAHFLPSSTTTATTASSAPALAPLLPLVRALTAHVSLLSPEIHSALVSAIVALPWAAGDDRFVKAFIGFCGVLVSAQPGWAKEVVDMAVRGLRWQPIMQSTSPAPISRRLFHARHHLLLAHLLSLIPTLPTVVQPLLAKHFPNKREPEVAQTTWVRNCCELISYCPELGQRVWGQIVDRMLRIDAEISKEEEDDEDEGEGSDDDQEGAINGRRIATAEADPFDLDITQDIPKPEAELDLDNDDESDLDIDELSSVEGSDSEDEGDDDEAKAAIARLKRRDAVQSMKEKLDGMLLWFFRHLEECMGGKPVSTPAAEMAAVNLASTTTNSSGASTPVGEYPNPMSSALPALSAAKPPVSPAQSLAHFQTLLNLFTRQILPTSSTQHIPFLLFFTASLTPSHTDLFLGLLVSQALYGLSTSKPTPGSQPLSLAQRIASTVYIGSVVCRAKFVSDEQARQVMTYLLAYIDGKMHQSPKPDDPPLFYAVCQAVLLIFCFRWRAFTADKEGESVLGEMELEAEESGEGDGKWMRDLDVLQRVITSDLNPLLGCNPTIVSTFAKVAHQTNFAYCFSIIEANQAHVRPSSSSNPTTPATANSTPSYAARSNSSLSNAAATNTARNARQANVDSGLDDYFPFDPYDLERSKFYVEGLYTTWSDVAISNDSDDEDSDDDDNDEEQEEEADDTVDSLGDSDLEDHLASKKMPKLKPSSGSYSDRRRMVFERERDGGMLSSSLEGMSISPNVPTALVGKY